MPARVEKITIKNVVEYLPALTRCGNMCLVSRYLLRHCAKRNHAGRHRTNGLIPYILVEHVSGMQGGRNNSYSFTQPETPQQVVDFTDLMQVESSLMASLRCIKSVKIILDIT